MKMVQRGPTRKKENHNCPFYCPIKKNTKKDNSINNVPYCPLSLLIF